MKTTDTRVCRLTVLSLILPLLAGCASVGPIYEDAPEPKESDALIYIYRPYASALGARKAYFYVDDVNIADLNMDGYTWFHMPAGEYLLKQKWPFDVSFGLKTIRRQVEWMPNRRYYYKLLTTGNIGGGATTITVSHQWQFAEVPEAVATEEIRRCKYQPALGAQKLVERHNR